MIFAFVTFVLGRYSTAHSNLVSKSEKKVDSPPEEWRFGRRHLDAQDQNDPCLRISSRLQALSSVQKTLPALQAKLNKHSTKWISLRRREPQIGGPGFPKQPTENALQKTHSKIDRVLAVPTSQERQGQAATKLTVNGPKRWLKEKPGDPVKV